MSLLAVGRARWVWLASAISIAGCAQGGDGRPEGQDSGSIRIRDGGMPRDAGDFEDMDAGEGETDAGDLEMDAGEEPMPDAGTDAGPPDSGPAPCTGSAECSNGIYCDGAERCELGSCVSGLALTCDDGIACTRDRCVEPAAGTTPTCSYTPDDALCAGADVCNPASGCMSSCSESPCRLMAPQCGCDAGESCYLSGAARSCEPTGAAAEGSSCSTFSSCQAGLICLNIAAYGTEVDQCGRFCEDDGDCVGAGSLCIYTVGDGVGGTVPDVLVCSRNCDPLTSTGCVAGASCQIFGETGGSMRYFTDCLAPVGTGGQGAFCIDSTDCRRGFICDGGTATCLRYCDEPGVVAGGGCGGFEACYGFLDPLLIGGVEYGVCDFF